MADELRRTWAEETSHSRTELSRPPTASMRLSGDHATQTSRPRFAVNCVNNDWRLPVRKSQTSPRSCARRPAWCRWGTGRLLATWTLPRRTSKAVCRLQSHKQELCRCFRRRKRPALRRQRRTSCGGRELVEGQLKQPFAGWDREQRIRLGEVALVVAHYVWPTSCPNSLPVATSHRTILLPAAAARVLLSGVNRTRLGPYFRLLSSWLSGFPVAASQIGPQRRSAHYTPPRRMSGRNCLSLGRPGDGAEARTMAVGRMEVPHPRRAHAGNRSVRQRIAEGVTPGLGERCRRKCQACQYGHDGTHSNSGHKILPRLNSPSTSTTDDHTSSFGLPQWVPGSAQPER